jgi:hypothetical protein
MELRLQRDPSQAAPRVLHVSEALVGEAVNQKLARLWPTPLVVGQRSDAGAGQVESCPIFQVHVKPYEGTIDLKSVGKQAVALGGFSRELST